jgi:hypothetical protein
MGGAIDKLLYALRNDKAVNPYILFMSIFGNVDDMNKFRHAIHSYEEGRCEYPERYEEAAQKMLDAMYKNESRIGRNNKNTTVRLNEGQLHSLISESVGRVLTEISSNLLSRAASSAHNDMMRNFGDSDIRKKREHQWRNFSRECNRRNAEEKNAVCPSVPESELVNMPEDTYVVMDGDGRDAISANFRTRYSGHAGTKEQCEEYVDRFYDKGANWEYLPSIIPLDDYFKYNKKNMRISESRLRDVITESVKRILSEIGYHEKQKHDQSEEEHDAWVAKMSAAKKREMEHRRKESGKESDSKAIDYYDYKHGKGNFQVMKEDKENTVRLSESQLHEIIKGSVAKVLKEHFDFDNLPDFEDVQDTDSLEGDELIKTLLDWAKEIQAEKNYDATNRWLALYSKIADKVGEGSPIYRA